MLNHLVKVQTVCTCLLLHRSTTRSRFTKNIHHTRYHLSSSHYSNLDQNTRISQSHSSFFFLTFLRQNFSQCCFWFFFCCFLFFFGKSFSVPGFLRDGRASATDISSGKTRELNKPLKEYWQAWKSISNDVISVPCSICFGVWIMWKRSTYSFLECLVSPPLWLVEKRQFGVTTWSFEIKPY